MLPKISIFKRFLFVIPIMAAACDPGMTIRQTNTKIDNANQTVLLEVRTSRQLIGETQYDPYVKLTNLTNTAITVTRVELSCDGKIYQNDLSKVSEYPLEIPAHRTKELSMWFDLGRDVKRTFEKTVELRVDYSSGPNESIAVASLAEGSLNDNTDR